MPAPPDARSVAIGDLANGTTEYRFEVWRIVVGLVPFLGFLAVLVYGLIAGIG